MALEIEILKEVKSGFDDLVLWANQNFGSGTVNLTVDTYFYDPLRRALQVSAEHELKEAFRLRCVNDEKYFITYKVDKFNTDGSWSHSEEYETQCESGSDVKSIIGFLGLKELVVVDNKKIKYTHQDFEIVLEAVEELGHFVEVEYKGSSQNVGQVKDRLDAFLEGFPCVLADGFEGGKPELLLKRKAGVF